MKVGLFLLAIVSLLTIWFIDYNKDINKRIDTERNVIPKGESKKIIEKHNGKMWAESVVGEYVNFFFTLPII